MTAIPLGHLLGIPLRINLSWLVIFAAVTYYLIAGQFPSRYPFWSPATYIAAGLLASLLFFGSVVLHELAHSVVARALGIPVHSITLFVFGGVAQIARDPPIPAGELLMAAAGPLASFWLAVFFGGVWALFRPFHEPTVALAGWLAWLNLSLGVFNLLPGFPMDGGRVLRSLLWWATRNRRTATSIALRIGRLTAWAFLVAGFTLVVMDTRQLFNGVWFAFIGWFLGQAVGASARQARLHEALDGYTARDTMTSDFAWVSPNTTLQQVVDDHAAARPRRWFLVVDEGKLRGILSAGELRRVPQRHWAVATAGEAMRPIERTPVVDPDTDAAEVLVQLDERGAGQAAVVQDGVLAGIVTHPGILRAAQIQPLSLDGRGLVGRHS